MNNKLLSFVVPFYKAEKYIKKHIKMWQELCNLVNVIIIEDEIDGSSEEFFKSEFHNKIQYYKKKNGNWGSVINYTKKHKIVKSKYMAIVDADDKIVIPELKKLILALESNNDDLIITNHKRVFLESKKEVTWDMSYWKTRKRFLFIHSLWFKTELLYKVQDLPEFVYFSDNLFIVSLLSVQKSIRFFNLTPYIYFKELPGQSVYEVRPDECKSWVKFLEYKKWFTKDHPLSRIILLHGLEKYIIYTRNKMKLKVAQSYYKDIYKKSTQSLIWNAPFFIKLLRMTKFLVRHKLNKQW